jgi:uncharacterized membrane protein YiaA
MLRSNNDWQSSAKEFAGADNVTRGMTMKKLTEWTAQSTCIWRLGGLGVALLIVGIVTAAINTRFGGFTPILWFLSAFACYGGVM